MPFECGGQTTPIWPQCGKGSVYALFIDNRRCHDTIIPLSE